MVILLWMPYDRGVARSCINGRQGKVADVRTEVFVRHLKGSHDIISFPLTTQGQLSAVGTIVSAGYGFICGAYMPISNFGAGLQKVLSYLPSTYATSLIKNHMLHGVFVEMERKHYPGEMVDVIKRTLDCNPVFHENVVSVNQMIGIMLGSIAVFGIIYYIVTVSSDR